MNFKLGQVVMTAAVASRIESDSAFAKFCHEAFGRYQRCDWGDLGAGDKDLNAEALRTGESRIFAAYIQPETNTKIWIITEWDRSATTILFPEDY